MTTALFCPDKYTGEFATLHYVEERGWQVTLWQFGKPIRYTPHQSIFEATLEIVSAGFMWASQKMQQIFEQDVLIAGE